MAVKIPFVREIDFEYGQPQQVSPLITRVVANNPGPFTYRGTGVYIVGHGQVAVIDPGPDDTAHIEALKRTLANKHVSHIFVTHRHLDHSPAARPLAAATGAKIYASGIAPRASFDDFVGEAGDDLGFQPDIVVGDGEVFQGDGWTLEAVMTPGHTSDHMCLALREENAIFSGDHIMGWSTTVVTPPDGDMNAYLASLDKIAARGVATLWPTHGPPVTEVAPFITAYRAHRLDREAQILARLQAGQTRIKDMVPVMYADVDPRLFPAASHSVLAHMIRLVQVGRVRTPGLPGLDSDYRLAN